MRDQRIEATRNQAILEHCGDGVMVADTEGRVILSMLLRNASSRSAGNRRADRSWTRSLGCMGVKSRVAGADRGAAEADPARYASGALPDRRLTVGRRYVSVHLFSLSMLAREQVLPGGVSGVVSVFRDITSEIEADRAKSDFVSTVSHELRTLMTSIVGYVDLMLHGAVGNCPVPRWSFSRGQDQRRSPDESGRRSVDISRI